MLSNTGKGAPENSETRAGPLEEINLDTFRGRAYVPLTRASGTCRRASDDS